VKQQQQQQQQPQTGTVRPQAAIFMIAKYKHAMQLTPTLLLP
jgi:hypothetical protein